MIENYSNKNLDDVINIENKSFNHLWLTNQFKSYSIDILSSRGYIYRVRDRIVGFFMDQ